MQHITMQCIEVTADSKLKAVIKREVINGNMAWRIEILFDDEKVLDRVVVDEIEVHDSFGRINVVKRKDGSVVIKEKLERRKRNE